MGFIYYISKAIQVQRDVIIILASIERSLGKPCFRKQGPNVPVVEVKSRLATHVKSIIGFSGPRLKAATM